MQTPAWCVFLLLQTDLMFLLPFKNQALVSQVHFGDHKNQTKKNKKRPFHHTQSSTAPESLETPRETDNLGEK